MTTTPTTPTPALLLRHWLTAMRLPFTSVAIVPFLAGVYVAAAHGRLASPLAAGLGALAVFLMCVGCYLSGEVCDQREDLATIAHGRNPFSGGTLLVAQGQLAPVAVQRAAAAAFVGAAIAGAWIPVIHGSLLLVGLGSFGLASAAFYSTRPARLVSRGIGEILIGFCYGWLTLATGYACASGQLPRDGVLFSLPVALSVFDIILLNEFPDYEADRSTGKRNLLVRVGRRAGAGIYAAAATLAGGSLIAVCHHFRGRSLPHLALTLPVAALALALAVAVGPLGAWRDRGTLKVLCGLTIVLNLLASVTVGSLVRW